MREFMLVSSRHKFVFLSNRKCASSSLVHSLQPFCDVIMASDHRLRHTSYSEYQQYLLPYLVNMIGDEVHDYKVYALFREPLDWIYSWYRFRCRKEISPEVQPDHWEYAGYVSWQEFMAETLKDEPREFASIGRQSRFVTSVHGGLEGLTLFRFDEVNSFVEHMSSEIGKQIELVRFNVSPKIEAQPNTRDMRRARKLLKQEFDIYEAIPQRSV